MTTVDVVIPTYRETARLFRAVDSAKRQTFSISTIWVLDDGSDQSVVDEIAARFSGDKQVVFKSVPHTGTPGKLRAMAIGYSSADWIAFLDSDDYWADDKTAKQLELAQQSRSDLVHSNAMKITNTDMEPYFPSGKFFPSPSFCKLVSDNKLINSSVMVRRMKLLEVDTYCTSSKVSGVEDYATWLRLATKAKLVGSPEPLTFYEVSPDGLSQQISPNKRIFALKDFLTWSRGRSTTGFVDRLGSVWHRGCVALRIFRESLV
jgi:glycosyltransferase involved in cell wall biosynthesis